MKLAIAGAVICFSIGALILFYVPSDPSYVLPLLCGVYCCYCAGNMRGMR